MCVRIQASTVLFSPMAAAKGKSAVPSDAIVHARREGSAAMVQGVRMYMWYIRAFMSSGSFVRYVIPMPFEW